MLDLLIVLVLVLCNAFFAMSEMAVLTSRKSRLKQMAIGSRRARKALHLAEHPESFLSAVQLWISLLSLMIGYFGGESMGAMNWLTVKPAAFATWTRPPLEARTTSISGLPESLLRRAAFGKLTVPTCSMRRFQASR